MLGTLLRIAIRASQQSSSLPQSAYVPAPPASMGVAYVCQCPECRSIAHMSLIRSIGQTPSGSKTKFKHYLECDLCGQYYPLNSKKMAKARKFIPQTRNYIKKLIPDETYQQLLEREALKLTPVIEQWTCQACGIGNDISSRKCSLCGSRVTARDIGL